MENFYVDTNSINIAAKDFSVSTTRVEPEYVLKVNNIPQVKSVSPKINPNPENLPAVIVKKSHKGRKAFAFFMFFTIVFIIAVLIGYNTVFYLFTI